MRISDRSSRAPLIPERDWLSIREKQRFWHPVPILPHDRSHRSESRFCHNLAHSLAFKGGKYLTVGGRTTTLALDLRPPDSPRATATHRRINGSDPTTFLFLPYLPEGIGAFFHVGLTIVMLGGRSRRCLFCFDAAYAATIPEENANAYDNSTGSRNSTLALRPWWWNVSVLFL